MSGRMGEADSDSGLAFVYAEAMRGLNPAVKLVAGPAHVLGCRYQGLASSRKVANLPTEQCLLSGTAEV